MAIRQSLREFAAQTTIHGLKELFASQRKLSTASWCLILLAAVGVMSVQVLLTTKEYMNTPTATLVNIEATTTFPDLIYCPHIWINESKLADLKFDSIAPSAYINSIFTDTVQREKMLGSVNNEQRQWYTTINDTLRSGLNEVDSFLFDHSMSKRELMERISISLEQFHVAKVNKDVNATVQKIINTRGVCIHLKDERTFEPYEAVRAQLVVAMGDEEFGKQGGAGQTTAAQLTGADSMFFGDKGLAAIPSGEYSFIPGVSYLVKIRRQVIKRLPAKGTCIPGINDVSIAECVLDCFKRECLEAGLCIPYDHRDANVSLREVCSYINPDNHCLLVSKDAQRCSSSCGAPCTLETFSSSFTAITGWEKVPYLVFSLENPESSTSIEEYATFSSTTLICNIGGVMALFLGCSVLSFVHMVYFCAFRCYETKLCSSKYGKYFGTKSMREAICTKKPTVKPAIPDV